MSCNPCYNGYGVHQLVVVSLVALSCNPCYNGYGVHRVACIWSYIK